MNFLKVKVVEEGGKVLLDEGSFKLEPVAAHVELLKKYVGKEISFGIRPEDLPCLEVGSGSKGYGVISAKVSVVEPLGAEIHLYASTPTQPMVARIAPHHLYKIGDAVHFTPVMEKARYFDRDAELSILPVKVDENAP